MTNGIPLPACAQSLLANVLLGRNEHCAECVLLKSFNWEESEIPFPNGLLGGVELRSLGSAEDMHTACQVKVYIPAFASTNPLFFFQVLIWNLFRIYFSKS